MRKFTMHRKSLLENRIRIVGAGLLLVLVAFTSEALTLGRVRGAALIGKPLDMVVPVQMDPGENAASECFEADVFHADTRQEASRVRVLVESTAQPGMANVRVLSSAVVDEPVVTVYLRAGCGQKTTRRYVLLADLPSEVGVPAVPLVVVASAPKKVNQVLAATAAAAATAVEPDPAVKGKAVRVPKPSAPRTVANRRAPSTAALVSGQASVSDGVSTAARPAMGQPRLRLDPLELLSDRVSNLDSYMTFAPPQDALDSMQKMQSLEESVKSLVALAAKNEASLADLRVRLQTAESNRWPLWAIYALIALALACLAAVALLWNRQRQGQASGDWRGQSIAASVLESHHASSAVAADQDKVAPSLKSRPVPLANDPRPSPGVDVNLTEMSDSNFYDFMPRVAKMDVDRRQSASSASVARPPGGTVRNFNPGASMDARQQAAFHVSIGQTDRAVQILKLKINDAGQPDPLVYLDLLGLLHSLGVTTGFQRMRETFNQLFGGQVGEFASFKNEGLGLESYPDVLSHISALWPAPQVVTWIEAAIFRNSTEDNSQGFDLTAFRDLLMLHAVAHRLSAASLPERRQAISSGQTASETPDFSSQEVTPFLELDLDLSSQDANDHGGSGASVMASDVNLPLLMPLEPNLNDLKKTGKDGVADGPPGGAGNP